MNCCFLITFFEKVVLKQTFFCLKPGSMRAFVALLSYFDNKIDKVYSTVQQNMASRQDSAEGVLFIFYLYKGSRKSMTCNSVTKLLGDKTACGGDRTACCFDHKKTRQRRVLIHASNTTRQNRVQDTFGVSTGWSKRRVVSIRLQHVRVSSVASGVYPSQLKLAKTVPIFKSDDETDTNSYRPISLAFDFIRTFEKMLYNRINLFIEEKKYSSQYGFGKAHSNQHAILDIVNAIQTNMDNGYFPVNYLLT